MNISIKKILKFCIMFCFLASLSVTLAHAKSGDIIGKVYSSDILATVNGYPIQSYNIGGKTVISVDELKDYGFYVWYDNGARRLYATAEYGRVDGSILNISVNRGKVGEIVGTLYETDIVSVINGIETKSYAVGDKICVCIEDLGDLTGSLNAEYGYSKYYMKCEWDAKNRIISLNALLCDSNDFYNSRIYKENGYGLYVTHPENSSEGFVEFADADNSLISGEFFGVPDKMIPLRLRCEGVNTDFIVGYMFSLNDSIRWYLFFDVLEQAFDEGYYHIVTHDERIAYINSHFIISQEHPYERFDTDICTVIYFEQHGLPHGYSSYNLAIVYMNGSYVRVSNLPLKDLALSDDGTKLTYVSVMNGKTYEVDLATAEVSEAMPATSNNKSIPESDNSVLRYTFITDMPDTGSGIGDSTFSTLTHDRQMVFEPVDVVDGWLFELAGEAI